MKKERHYLKFGYGYNEARDNKPYYKASNEDGTTTKCYCTWFNMMKRCYDTTSNDYEMYKDCEVIMKWHNFQAFAEWWIKIITRYQILLCLWTKTYLKKGIDCIHQKRVV